MGGPAAGGAIVYIDHCDVVPGRLSELKVALRELAAFVESNEPWLVAYDVYVDEAAGEVSVLHVHTGSDSLRRHMQTAGPRFAPFAGLVRLRRIDVYGRPGDDVVEMLRDKARMLGTGEVRVHDFHAGFLRPAAAP